MSIIYRDQKITPELLKGIRRGALLSRPLIEGPAALHEGIYVGEKGGVGWVCHVMGPDGKKNDWTLITKVTLEVFRAERDVTITYPKSLYSEEEIANRAEQRVGDWWNYHWQYYNCQSFANICCNDNPESHQGKMLEGAKGYCVGSVFGNAYNMQTSFLASSKGLSRVFHRESLKRTGQMGTPLGRFHLDDILTFGNEQKDSD